MKKSSVIIFSALSILIALSGIVAAQAISATELGAPQLPALTPGSFADFLYQFFKSAFDIIGNILFNTSEQSAFYTKVLIFILIFAVLYPVTKKLKISANDNLNLLIAFLVSAMGVRFLTDKLVNLIMLPYGTLAIVISSIIPIAILVGVSESGLMMGKPWMQKIMWVLTGVSFIGLWIHRLSDVGAAANIYLLSALICIIMLIWEKKLGVHQLVYGHYSAAIINIEIEIARLANDYATAVAAGNDALARVISGQIVKKEAALKTLQGQAQPSWLKPVTWIVITIMVLFIAYMVTSTGAMNTLKDVFNFG